MRTRLLTLLLPSFVLACGDREPPDNQPPPLQPIEKTSALETANRNFRTVVVGAARSGGFAEDHQLLGGLFSLAGSSDPQQPEGPTLEADANEMADDLAARILTVANVEVEEETRIVLSMKPEVYCANTSTSAGTSSCVQMLNAVPIKLELTTRRENNIDAALTVGIYSVATVQFHPDVFAVEVDFGALRDAAEALANASGEPLEEITGTIRGRVRVELRVNGANDYMLSLSILSPIDIDATINGETLMLDIGTSSPLASLRIDGNTPQVVFQSNVGAIDMKVPLGIVQVEGDPEAQPLTGTIGVHVEPTSLQVTLDTSNTAKINRYSSGGANITYDGVTIVSYSVNDGQMLSGAITFDEASTTFSVSPMLDVRAQLDLNPLVDQLDPDFPPALLRDSLQLLLNGSSQPTVRTRTIETTEVDPDGNTIVKESTSFEVVEGRLTLSSSAAGKTVVVEAGMCLDSIEADPEATSSPHPLELLVATTCE